MSGRAFGSAIGVALALVSTFAAADPTPSPYAEPPIARAAAPDAAEDPAAADRVSRESAKLSVGPGYRRLFSTSITGADADLSLGRQTRLGAWYVNAAFMSGRTPYGLTAWNASLGGSWEFRLNRLRFGLGGRASYVAVARATTTEDMSDWGLGLTGFASFDLVRFDNHAFYLAAAITSDFMLHGESPAIWGPTGSLGIRF